MKRAASKILSAVLMLCIIAGMTFAMVTTALAGNLTLHNYSYSGKGYKVPSLNSYSAVIWGNVLNIVLEGENVLSGTDSSLQVCGIWANSNCTVTSAEKASLDITAKDDGITTDGEVSLHESNITINAGMNGIYSYKSGMTIGSGSVDIVAKQYAISVDEKLYVNDGRVSAKSDSKEDKFFYAICGTISYNKETGLEAKASIDPDGELVSFNLKKQAVSFRANGSVCVKHPIDKSAFVW